MRKDHLIEILCSSQKIKKFENLKTYPKRVILLDTVAYTHTSMYIWTCTHTTHTQHAYTHMQHIMHTHVDCIYMHTYTLARKPWFGEIHSQTWKLMKYCTDYLTLACIYLLQWPSWPFDCTHQPPTVFRLTVAECLQRNTQMACLQCAATSCQ